jgi:hypothetical protein
MHPPYPFPEKPAHGSPLAYAPLPLPYSSLHSWGNFTAGFLVGGLSGVAWGYVCTQILPCESAHVLTCLDLQPNHNPHSNPCTSCIGLLECATYPLHRLPPVHTVPRSKRAVTYSLPLPCSLVKTTLERG